MFLVCFTDKEKVVGESWTNVGVCVGDDSVKTCGPGPGQQKQTRDCEDGTFETCKNSDKEQKINCDLPKCSTIATTTGKGILFRILYWETMY